MKASYNGKLLRFTRECDWNSPPYRRRGELIHTVNVVRNWGGQKKIRFFRTEDLSSLCTKNNLEHKQEGVLTLCIKVKSRELIRFNHKNLLGIKRDFKQATPFTVCENRRLIIQTSSKGFLFEEISFLN